MLKFHSLPLDKALAYAEKIDRMMLRTPHRGTMRFNPEIVFPDTANENFNAAAMPLELALHLQDYHDIEVQYTTPMRAYMLMEHRMKCEGKTPASLYTAWVYYIAVSAALESEDIEEDDCPF